MHDERDDLAAIRAIRAEVEESENALDAARFARLFADDVAMLPSELDPVHGAAAVEAFHRDLYRRFDELEMRFEIDGVRVLGGLAVEWGTYTGRTVVDGREGSGGGDYLYTYVRSDDGSWLIHRMSWS